MMGWPAKIVTPFTDIDTDRAFDEWGCNCGPTALAAILGIGLDAVRQLCGQTFAAKRYMSPTMMWAALDRSGRPWRKMREPLPPPMTVWPVHGLARVQWHGPWMAPGVPIKARYWHTHWVAAQTIAGDVGVFDVNAMQAGGWVSLDSWSRVLVPYIIEHGVPRGDGRWSLTHVVEVDRELTK